MGRAGGVSVPRGTPGRRKSRPGGKTQGVRDALTMAGRPLNLFELQKRLERRTKQVIGKAKLYQLLARMVHAGEIETVGRGDTYRFYWFRWTEE